MRRPTLFFLLLPTTRGQTPPVNHYHTIDAPTPCDPAPPTVILHAWHKTGTFLMRGVGRVLLSKVCHYSHVKSVDALHNHSYITPNVGIGDWTTVDRPRKLAFE